MSTDKKFTRCLEAQQISPDFNYYDACRCTSYLFTLISKALAKTTRAGVVAGTENEVRSIGNYVKYAQLTVLWDNTGGKLNGITTCHFRSSNIRESNIFPKVKGHYN
jgi:hypothetical protein